MRVKVIGAGSIGNHLSNAARQLGWSVDLCDADDAALERTRTQIYPGRYAAWDDGIRLFKAADAPTGEYDLICVGTPPDSHIFLGLAALAEKPQAVLIEKPLCTPNLEGAQKLYDLSRDLGVAVFAGYDHVVGKATEQASAILIEDLLGAVSTIDMEFREYWGGIFNAHPWLDGPQDSYLGYSKRGGGASGEHSHAANLWQHFAHACGGGRIVDVAATLDFVRDGTVDYDRLCLANVTTQSGLTGRIVQDVITQPPRKWARIQGDQGFVEWHCGFKPGCDSVVHQFGETELSTTHIEKTRPQDFIRELQHIEHALTSDSQPVHIGIERGLDTMLVIAAIHLSHHERRSVRIDYAKGYTLDALSTR
jgi:predicted dehydrogenase